MQRRCTIHSQVYRSAPSINLYVIYRITRPFFFGCIELVNGLTSKWDFLGIEHGCDSALVSNADFSGGDASLEIAQPVRLSSDSQIGSMFKSTDGGMLMNAENEVRYILTL